jgi:hypothetical protein
LYAYENDTPISTTNPSINGIYGQFWLDLCSWTAVWRKFPGTQNRGCPESHYDVLGGSIFFKPFYILKEQFTVC